LQCISTYQVGFWGKTEKLWEIGEFLKIRIP